jgi:hypothetical protein
MTHRRQKADMEKARQSGVESYCAEQLEKAELLDIFLSDYNDGRKRTLFCTAVNLLDVQELREVLGELRPRADGEALTPRESSALAASLLQAAAARKQLDLKLRRKP